MRTSGKSTTFGDVMSPARSRVRIKVGGFICSENGFLAKLNSAQHQNADARYGHSFDTFFCAGVLGRNDATKVRQDGPTKVELSEE